MTLRLLAAASVACALTAAGASVAAAEPLGHTTLDETIQVQGGYGANPGKFVPLVPGKGEPYIVRGDLTRAKPNRVKKRRSLAFFGQITDPQVADEMSPARVELLDPASGEVSAAFRPQEALGVHSFDETIRNLNANRTSPVKQGNGKRAKMGFAITTGDLPDNSQRNETQWFVSILDGGRVDPYSGKPVSATNPCPGATDAELAQIGDDVTNRRYVGIQDFGIWPASTPAERQSGFWDPDQPSAGGGKYAEFPRYPGLLDRAQQPFTAAGLDVPWYSSRGNHDGLVQGNAPASSAIFKSIVTGCLKILPSAAFDPASVAGESGTEIFAKVGQPAFAAGLLGGAVRVPPDPDRAFVSKPEYRSLQGTADHDHGFGLTDPSELKASDDTAMYYAWSPRPGLRMISLDTVAEGGGAAGNVDNPQFQWLKRELAQAQRKDQLIIVYSHHTLETMNNPTPDEAAGCSNPLEAGCDGDPRNSRPLHLGLTGRDSVGALLKATPNVIAYVNGHMHHNAVRAFKGAHGHGFWQINTAAHIDFPEQSRQIELMDNRDGTLSLFGTILDTASPVEAPAPGPAAGFTDAQLGSLARLLAANDPQTKDVTSGGGPGAPDARNVELLIKDPRRQ
jgi:metallophosphoesterase (TIGR03767 family)